MKESRLKEVQERQKIEISNCLEPIKSFREIMLEKYLNQPLTKNSLSEITKLLDLTLTNARLEINITPFFYINEDGEETISFVGHTKEDFMTWLYVNQLAATI